ncbi:hypothetical protein SCALM49S_06546 [Streptomyces californicus]
MSLSVLLAASPSPEPVGSLGEAAEQAGNAAGWVEENWSTWLSTGLRILLIIAVAITLRYLIRRALTNLIDRMNRSAQAVEGTALGGLLVNAERRRQRSEAIGSVLRSVASFLIMGTAALMVLGAFKMNLAPLLARPVSPVWRWLRRAQPGHGLPLRRRHVHEGQYGVGDTVDAGVASGEVIEVGLRVTRVRGDIGGIWYVRNGEVWRSGPQPGLVHVRGRRHRAPDRGPGAGPQGDHRGRRRDDQGGALVRAAVRAGRGVGPGRVLAWTR